MHPYQRPPPPKCAIPLHKFPSLPFPSLPFPSLPFPSLPFPSLPHNLSTTGMIGTCHNNKHHVVGIQDEHCLSQFLCFLQNLLSETKATTFSISTVEGMSTTRVQRLCCRNTLTPKGFTVDARPPLRYWQRNATSTCALRSLGGGEISPWGLHSTPDQP